MARSGIGKEFAGLLGQNSAFISAFSVGQVCLTWYVFVSTRSAVSVGIVSIVYTLSAMIFSLPVGYLVDRTNKAILMVVAGITGAVVFAAFGIISERLAFSLPIVVAFTGIWGISRELSRSSGLSALPDLVNENSLSRANGIFRALSSSIGTVFNALAGIMIITIGVFGGFYFSSGAYVVSGIFAILLIFPFYRSLGRKHDDEGSEKHSMISDLREGFVWLIQKKGMFLLTISATFFNFFLEMVITFIVIYVGSGLQGSSLDYGIVLSALAAGDVAGSLVAGRLDLLRHSGKVNILLYGGVPGIAILAMALFPGMLVASVSTFIAGFCLGTAINLWLTTAHNVVPPEMRGRYFALDGVLASISPASIGAGAAVIAFAGVINDFLLAGILLLASTVVFSFMKSLWTLDGRSQKAIASVGAGQAD